MRKGIIASVLLAALPFCAFASGGEAECAPVPGAGTKSEAYRIRDHGD